MTPRQLIAYHKRGRTAAYKRIATHQRAQARSEASGLVSLAAERFLARAVEAALDDVRFHNGELIRLRNRDPRHSSTKSKGR